MGPLSTPGGTPGPAGGPFRSFDLLQLQRAGQTPGVYSLTFQIVMFVLLYVGFAIKVPLFPFHTWLPDAHVEAPTPISMILAGILLKMGGYGFIRIAYPICPQAAIALAWPLALIGVWNILYGALAAMAQTDFKKLVAYSSISHMGYVLLGMAVWSATGGLNRDIWSMAMNGAMFQMIAHGISSPAMFFAVGVIYDRLHHRDLNRFGGLANEMPLYAGISAVIFFAGMGLPGLCGFIGEVFVVLGTWQFSPLLAILAAAGVILTAGYILWTLQRVFLGTPRETAHGHGHGDSHHAAGHGTGLPEITTRELVCAIPLIVLAVVLGVYPDSLFSLMEPTVTKLVNALSQVRVEQVAALLPMLR
jgi:NADH-quinone oxidoreductase subunit M